MYKDDFLDAVIIIGWKLYWDDRFTDSVRYMSIKNIRRHTSMRVYREVIGVFKGRRRLMLKYLGELNKECRNNKFNLSHIDRSIETFTKKFINTHNIDKKDIKTIRSFLKNGSNITDIKRIIISGDDFSVFEKKIIDTVNTVILSIKKECYHDNNAIIFRYDNCPSDYGSCLKKERTGLYNIIKYDEDVDILLDSYYIKINHINNDIRFITVDYKHILENKPDIEAIIPGISLFDPKDIND